MLRDAALPQQQSQGINGSGKEPEPAVAEIPFAFLALCQPCRLLVRF
jgi:hypothetical protein